MLDGFASVGWSSELEFRAGVRSWSSEPGVSAKGDMGVDTMKCSVWGRSVAGWMWTGERQPRAPPSGEQRLIVTGAGPPGSVL